MVYENLSEFNLYDINNNEIKIQSIQIKNFESVVILIFKVLDEVAQRVLQRITLKLPTKET